MCKWLQIRTITNRKSYCQVKLRPRSLLANKNQYVILKCELEEGYFPAGGEKLYIAWHECLSLKEKDKQETVKIKLSGLESLTEQPP